MEGGYKYIYTNGKNWFLQQQKNNILGKELNHISEQKNSKDA